MRAPPSVGMSRGAEDEEDEGEEERRLGIRRNLSITDLSDEDDNDEEEEEEGEAHRSAFEGLGDLGKGVSSSSSLPDLARDDTNRGSATSKAPAESDGRLDNVWAVIEEMGIFQQMGDDSAVTRRHVDSVVEGLLANNESGGKFDPNVTAEAAVNVIMDMVASGTMPTLPPPSGKDRRNFSSQSFSQAPP